MRSQIGAVWAILHPLAQAAIFATVLSKVLGARLSGVAGESAYAIYLMAGLAVWSLFAEILTRCLTVFIEYGNTMKKIAFPRISLPFVVLGGAWINHLLLLSATLVVFILLGQTPHWTWLVLPLASILTSVLAVSLGVLLGVFNVFSRDVSQAMLPIMQLWFWLTPIVYVRGILPDGLAEWVWLNPVTPLVTVFQQALVFNQLPSGSELVYPLVLSLTLGAIATLVFRRASSDLVDAV